METDRISEGDSVSIGICGRKGKGKIFYCHFPAAFDKFSRGLF